MGKYTFTPGLDLPVCQTLRLLPVAAAAGACLCNDPRGTNRYLYALLGATSFWRYDVLNDAWQQLASPNSITFAAGCDMKLDPSRGTAGYIWLFAPSSSSPYAVFQYYDIASNTWTSRNAPSGLGAQFGTDASLEHTCSALNPAGDDDALYLIGNASTVWYKYSISGNSWSTMATALPVSTGAGGALVWLFNGNSDKLIYIVGNGSAAIYSYSIGTAGFAAITYLPGSETFSTGTSVSYWPSQNAICITRDATHRLYKLDLVNNLLTPLGSWIYIAGTAIVGDGQLLVITPDGTEWLYYRRLSGQDFWRMEIGG